MTQNWYKPQINTKLPKNLTLLFCGSHAGGTVELIAVGPIFSQGSNTNFMFEKVLNRITRMWWNTSLCRGPETKRHKTGPRGPQHLHYVIKEPAIYNLIWSIDVHLQVIREEIQKPNKQFKLLVLFICVYLEYRVSNQWQHKGDRHTGT